MAKLDRRSRLGPGACVQRKDVHVVLAGARHVELPPVRRKRDPDVAVRYLEHLLLHRRSFAHVEHEHELGGVGWQKPAFVVDDEVVAAGQDQKRATVRAQGLGLCKAGGQRRVIRKSRIEDRIGGTLRRGRRNALAGRKQCRFGGFGRLLRFRDCYRRSRQPCGTAEQRHRCQSLQSHSVPSLKKPRAAPGSGTGSQAPDRPGLRSFPGGLRASACHFSPTV